MNIHTRANIDPLDSYGLIACELARHLCRAGVNTNIVSLGKRDMPHQAADIAEIVSQPVEPSEGGIFLGWPTNYHKYDVKPGRRIALTMHESTKIPAGWAEVLNEMDAVITPARFSKRVLQEGGVTAPIHVVPLGIGEVFQPHYRKQDQDRPFTFLAFADRGDRKNFHAAEQAFVRAFGRSMKYRLLLKARSIGAKHLNPLNPNIDIIYQDMSEQELYELYCSCDCLVFPSRGEGWGFPPREAAATGLPVIATNWSGLADDIDVWGIPLDYEMVTAEWRDVLPFRGQDLGQWAEPSIDHLTELMKCVVEMNTLYRLRAHQAARSMHSLYSWSKLAAFTYDLWRGN